MLRPAVFGANDGLVSNLALVMGVAGANPAPGVIVLAGVAGLLAGAFSMAVGEYISVRSQRELLDHQLAFERAQIRDTPDQEREILARVYQGRGFTEAEASHFVERVFADPEHAATLLIFEEVGLDARSIGSPAAAAGSSFVAFVDRCARAAHPVPAARRWDRVRDEPRRRVSARWRCSGTASAA